MKSHTILSARLRKASVFLAVILALAFYTNSSQAQISVGASIDVQNYVPPPWAPPYDNVSSTRYYYFPDYGMYYDVWDGQYWYMGPGGVWMASDGLPPAYAGVDLNSAFIVLIDRDVSRPWMNYSYYYHNYPAHGYDNYRDIVSRNRIVTNIAPGHTLVPRAFNENTNRVTFMQRPPQNAAAHGSASYHRVVHEVPMRSIAPSMPAASRNLNYGRGYSKPAAASRGGGPPRGGGGSKGGGGKR
jgi:hypothetical protein